MLGGGSELWWHLFGVYCWVGVCVSSRTLPGVSETLHPDLYVGGARRAEAFLSQVLVEGLGPMEFTSPHYCLWVRVLGIT